MKPLPALMLLLFLSTHSNLQAQNLILKGKILYASSQEAVPFCSIQLKEYALGTVSDYKGNFYMNIPIEYAKGILLISYVGLKKQELSISSIQNPANMTILMEEEVSQLEEVLVTTEKMNATNILKKAIQKIPSNYPTENHYLEAYYRETLKENGAYIKYADAACQFYCNAYVSSKAEIRNLDKRVNLNKAMNANIWIGKLDWGKRLHDHFSVYYPKEVLVQIQDARASENLSSQLLEANIEGGPLATISKDIVHYLDWFMNIKEFEDYVYEGRHAFDSDQNSCIVISFSPSKKPMEDAELEKLLSKQERISRFDILAGEIWIDEKTMAFKSISFSVPPKYKKHICNYQMIAFKHFGYSVDIQYQQAENGRWYLKQIEQMSEFIVKDSTGNVTPYQANTSLYVHKITPSAGNTSGLSGKRVYSQMDIMPLFNEPLEYHPKFWTEYGYQYPVSNIPDSIRKNLEVALNLEKQFADTNRSHTQLYRQLEKQFENRAIQLDSLIAPIAPIKPLLTTIHQDTIWDNYAWLKDTSSLNNLRKDVLEYLIAENDYYEEYITPLQGNSKALLNKIIQKIPKESLSVPTYQNGYYYFSNVKKDNLSPIICRTRTPSLMTKEFETILDLNPLTKGQGYFELRDYQISPDNAIIAYSLNTNKNQYALYVFKNIDKNEILPDTIFKADKLIWINPNSFLYTKQETGTMRSFQVWKHYLNTPQSADELLYEEKDKAFHITLDQSADHFYLLMSCKSQNSTEVHFYDTRKDKPEFLLIHPRETNHLYSVSVFENTFYILSNKNAPDRQILSATPDFYTIENWKLVVPHRLNHFIEDFSVLEDYFVVHEVFDARNKIVIMGRKKGKIQEVDFGGEEFFQCKLAYDTSPLRKPNTVDIEFSSLKSPSIYYTYDIPDKRLEIKKEEKLPGEIYFYSKKKGLLHFSNYTIERVYATASDGTKIPITLFYDKLRKKNPSNRLWITGHGSKGINLGAGYSSELVSIIDAGFVYAIAHVRGGNECGAAWYEDGKMMNKMNTFTDFIACTEYLIAQGYTSADKIVAEGASAGGLLMGAIANMRPDLYNTIVLNVPFVDVINTMMDEKLPLTTSEYKEWGNPNIAEEYRYIKTYSPYDNVKAQNYPNMLFYTGLNDRNVGFWEATKMVAKLRAMKTNDNFLGLKTDFSSGHGGGSGRYTLYKEFSEKLALVLDLLKRQKKIE